MICRLFIEEGDYLDIETGEERNLFCVIEVHTPEGEADEWIGGFNTIEDAMEYFNVELKPEPEEEEDIEDASKGM